MKAFHDVYYRHKIAALKTAYPCFCVQMFPWLLNTYLIALFTKYS